MKWFDKIIKASPKPTEYVLESDIQKYLPEELKESWNKFIEGQTCLLLGEDIKDLHNFGIYRWDFDRFVAKWLKNQKLEDTSIEWD